MFQSFSSHFGFRPTCVRRLPGHVAVFSVAVNVECGPFWNVLLVTGHCEFTALFAFGNPGGCRAVVVTSFSLGSAIVSKSSGS